jgi:hypothetical protein
MLVPPLTGSFAGGVSPPFFQKKSSRNILPAACRGRPPCAFQAPCALHRLLSPVALDPAKPAVVVSAALCANGSLKSFWLWYTRVPAREELTLGICTLKVMASTGLFLLVVRALKYSISGHGRQPRTILTLKKHKQSRGYQKNGLNKEFHRRRQCTKAIERRKPKRLKHREY